MIMNVLSLVLVVKLGFKSFEPSRENSYLCGREQLPEGFTVHMNSNVNIFV